MKNLISIYLFFLAFFFLSCDVNIKNHHLDLLEIRPPESTNSMQPYLSVNQSNLIMTWTERKNDSIFGLYFSRYQNNIWTQKIEIISGQDWFVNWADFPSVSGSNDHLISFYLKKSDKETFAYDIFIKQSNDSGKHWDIGNKLHKDTTKSEHGFVSLSPSNSDSFFVSWLDGRKTKSMGHEHDHDKVGGAMQLRTAEIMHSGDIKNEVSLDTRTCDCCQTSTATTEDGPIVVYRDRSEDEIRDIYFVKYKQGSWSKPKAIFNDNWKINGCPVNGPKVAVEGNTVGVVWFTAANDKPIVNLSFSVDRGDSFNQPIQVNELKAIGRVDLLMLDEESALISWMESSEDDALLKLAKVSRDGSIDKIVTIDEISASRSTGFPQMEMVDNQIYMAWNNIENDKSTVKLFRLSLESLN